MGEHTGHTEHDGYGSAVQEALRGPARELRRAIPDVYKGFAALHDSALTEGALDTKTKELVAFAIAVSECCDGCIAAHAHAAVRHGATPQEAAETIGVAILMNGGPATIYGPRAFAAFQEFYEAAHPQAEANGHAAAAN
jgi:AhpD family alkylhydroperoxidase